MNHPPNKMMFPLQAQSHGQVALDFGEPHTDGLNFDSLTSSMEDLTVFSSDLDVDASVVSGHLKSLEELCQSKQATGLSKQADQALSELDKITRLGIAAAVVVVNQGGFRPILDTINKFSRQAVIRTKACDLLYRLAKRCGSKATVTSDDVGLLCTILKFSLKDGSVESLVPVCRTLELLALQDIQKDQLVEFGVIPLLVEAMTKYSMPTSETTRDPKFHDKQGLKTSLKIQMAAILTLRSLSSGEQCAHRKIKLVSAGALDSIVKFASFSLASSNHKALLICIASAAQLVSFGKALRLWNSSGGHQVVIETMKKYNDDERIIRFCTLMLKNGCVCVISPANATQMESDGDGLEEVGINDVLALADGLDVLVSIIKKWMGSKEIVSNSLVVLRGLWQYKAKNQSLKQKIDNLSDPRSLVPLLVAVLRVFMDTLPDSILTPLLVVLALLIREQRGMSCDRILLDAGGLPAILTALSKTVQPRREVCISGLLILQNLENSTQNKRAIIEAGGILVMVNIMCHFPQDALLQGMVTGALCKLGRLLVESEFVRMEGIALIHQALRTHLVVSRDSSSSSRATSSSDAMFALEGCRCLHILGGNPRHAQAMYASGFLETLVTILEIFSERQESAAAIPARPLPEEVHYYTLAAIGVILGAARSSPNGIPGAERIVAAVVRVMKRHVNHHSSRVPFRSCHVLVELASCKATAAFIRSEIIVAGGLDVIDQARARHVGLRAAADYAIEEILGKRPSSADCLAFLGIE